jgi:hypothetical protein
MVVVRCGLASGGQGAKGFRSQKGAKRREKVKGAGGRVRREGWEKFAPGGAQNHRNPCVVGTDRETTKLQNPKKKVEKTRVGAEDNQFFTLGNRDHSHLVSHSFPPGNYTAAMSLPCERTCLSL